MSIERLNKAASAAGFAMATPDDDSIMIDDTPVEVDVTGQARALVPSLPVHRIQFTDSLNSFAAWMKGVWPSLGWRQPA
jgi:hypothetical protein